jgi:hypothetical protein
LHAFNMPKSKKSKKPSKKQKKALIRAEEEYGILAAAAEESEILFSEKGYATAFDVRNALLRRFGNPYVEKKHIRKALDAWLAELEASLVAGEELTLQLAVARADELIASLAASGPAPPLAPRVAAAERAVHHTSAWEVSAAHAQQRRFASSGGGMDERHVQLLGLRMDALKQNKLSEDDLQAAFDNTVGSAVGHDSHYFRALEALGALKLVVRHGTQELVGLRGGAKVAREWPAFHPEEMSQLGAATESRPAPRGIAIGLAAGIAPMPVHAGDRVRVERGSYQGKFATVVRPTAARYIVRLDRGRGRAL